MRVDDRDLLSCCSLSYSHPAVRWLMGDSLHPGGLELTGRLAGLLEIGPGTRVLDAGCGSGDSSVYLARTLGCRVLGVTLEEEGAARGRELAERHGVGGLVRLERADLRYLEVDEPVDAAVMECVLSIVPEKAAALRRLGASLRPGGRLGITDVTVAGTLPPGLQGMAGRVGCLAGAAGLPEYRRLLEEAGFAVEHAEELPGVARGFLEELRKRLLIGRAAIRLGAVPVDEAVLERASELLAEVERLVGGGDIGYCLLVARP